MNAALALTVLLYLPLAADDPEPLHVRIDKAVEAAHVGTPAPVADDAAFLRRAFLDLAGRIPGPAEALAFLVDKAPDKRARLVDRLLATPEHVRTLAVTFDVWLMERRGDKHVKTDEWRGYLLGFFAANRPYTELARDILGSDGSDPALRPAAKFVLDRDVAPDALTRDVGRVLFGMDLQCAQCHDHPRIVDYLQRDYYGIYAFLSRSYLFTPGDKKPSVVAEKPEGEAAFKSVFTKAEGSTRPRLPEGSELQEPSFAKGDEWQVKPDPKDKTLRPVPKYSRRAQLARLAAEGPGRSFDRNIVNRLWAHMMGRGIVEPVDLHHSDNPPSHPELLEMLAVEFAAMKYDVRAFLRQLALTRTYQRSTELPADLARQAQAAAAKQASLAAEAKGLEEALTKAKDASRKAAEELETAKKAVAAAAAELAKADAAATPAKKALDAAAAAREAARKELAARQDLEKTLSEAAKKASDAAARLADDKELAAAAATFRARAERMGGEGAAAAKDLADKAAAVTAKEADLAAAQKGAEAIRARKVEADARVQALANAFADVESRRRAAKVATRTAERRAEDARTLADIGPLEAAAAQSREAHRRIKADLAAAREGASKLAAELPALEARIDEATAARDIAAAAAEETLRALAAKGDVLRAVAEAASKAEEVAQKAAKDAELVSAAARVKAKKDRLAADTEELRQAAARREEASRRTAADLAALRQRETALLGAKGRIPALEAQLKPAVDRAAAARARLDEAMRKLTSGWTERFAVADLTPLTPEQICWSMMKATGLVDRQRAAAEAEFARKTPQGTEAERARFAEQSVYDKLKGNEAAFVKLFGAAPGQPQDEFYATVDQALFLANGGMVRGWLAPAEGNLSDRLLKLGDPKGVARELYLGTLSRPPSDAEVAQVEKYLARRPQAKTAAVQEMVWAMLTSVEFRFKH